MNDKTLIDDSNIAYVYTLKLSYVYSHHNSNELRCRTALLSNFILSVIPDVYLQYIEVFDFSIPYVALLRSMLLFLLYNCIQQYYFHLYCHLQLLFAYLR